VTDRQADRRTTLLDYRSQQSAMPLFRCSLKTKDSIHALQLQKYLAIIATDNLFLAQSIDIISDRMWPSVSDRSETVERSGAINSTADHRTCTASHISAGPGTGGYEHGLCGVVSI